jgi:hypothetical protein
MDPNPIKHEAVLLARVRDGILPALTRAGFQLDSRNKGGSHLWIDFCRNEETLSLRFDKNPIVRVAVERLGSDGGILVLGQMTFSIQWDARARMVVELSDDRSTAEVIGQLDPRGGDIADCVERFIVAISETLARLYPEAKVSP